MKILVDMNLPPEWVEVLKRNGWEAIHWSGVGDPRTSDHFIMDWARSNDFVVFTHDLDFGALLASTQAMGPSVIQVRTQNVMPAHLEELVVKALTEYESTLEQGALIVVEEARSRVRILPITP